MVPNSRATKRSKVKEVHGVSFSHHGTALWEHENKLYNFVNKSYQNSSGQILNVWEHSVRESFPIAVLLTEIDALSKNI